jgi:hypothetical protein
MMSKQPRNMQARTCVRCEASILRNLAAAETMFKCLAVLMRAVSYVIRTERSNEKRTFMAVDTIIEHFIIN